MSIQDGPAGKIEERIAVELRTLARRKWHDSRLPDQLATTLALPRLAEGRSLPAERLLHLKTILLEEVMPRLKERDVEAERSDRSVATAARILYRLDHSTAGDRLQERQQAIAARWDVHPGYFAQALEPGIHREVGAILASLGEQEVSVDPPRSSGGREFHGDAAREVVYSQLASQLFLFTKDLTDALAARSTSDQELFQEIVRVAIWRLYCSEHGLADAYRQGFILGGLARSSHEYAAAEAILIAQFHEPFFGVRGRAALASAARESDADSFLNHLEGSGGGKKVLSAWEKWIASSCDLKHPEPACCAVHQLIRLYDYAVDLLRERNSDVVTEAVQGELRQARLAVFSRSGKAIDQKGERASQHEPQFVILSSPEFGDDYRMAVRMEEPAIPVLGECRLQRDADLANGIVYAEYRETWG